MVFADLNRNFLSGVKADESEPSDDYKANPEGSVSIIDVSKGVANVKQSDVRTAGFKQFNGTRLDPSIRIYGPGATVAQDIKPDFIAFYQTAWVTVQEANAIEFLDVDSATFTRLVGLGLRGYTGYNEDVKATGESGSPDANERDGRYG